MLIRYIKTLFAVLTSLMALIYVTQNMVNTDAAHQAILYVMSGADHQVYTESFGPKFTHPLLGWLAVIIIFGLEYLTGLLLAKGAWDMWQARNLDAGQFQAAKKWALIGSTTGVIVWYGLFGIIGTAYFQMWQTQVGTGSMNGAFQYFVYCAITLIFINQRDE